MTRRLDDPNRGRCRVCTARFTYEPRPGPPPVTCSDACRSIRRRAQHRDDRRRLRARRRLHDARILASLVPDTVRLGPRATLTPMQVGSLLERHARGWTTAALATAYGVSGRTVQRYLELERPRVIQIDTYAAWFAARRTGPPVQLSDWIAVTRGPIHAKA